MHLQISATGTRDDILNALTTQLWQAVARQPGVSELVGAATIAYAGARLQDLADDAPATVAITVVIDVAPGVSPVGAPPDPAAAAAPTDA